MAQESQEILVHTDGRACITAPILLAFAQASGLRKVPRRVFARRSSGSVELQWKEFGGAKSYDLSVRDRVLIGGFKKGQRLQTKIKSGSLEIVQGTSSSPPKEPPLEEALGFLRGILANGAVSQTEVWKQAAARGIKERTLRRALHEVGQTQQKARQWLWTLKSPPTKSAPRAVPARTTASQGEGGLAMSIRRRLTQPLDSVKKVPSDEVISTRVMESICADVRENYKHLSLSSVVQVLDKYAPGITVEAFLASEHTMPLFDKMASGVLKESLLPRLPPSPRPRLRSDETEGKIRVPQVRLTSGIFSSLEGEPMGKRIIDIAYDIEQAEPTTSYVDLVELRQLLQKFVTIGMVAQFGKTRATRYRLISTPN